MEFATRADQHPQWAVGETITLASTTQVNAVSADQWRAHAGQAISVLSGAAQHIDIAATAQGVSITIEAGNITFECPGTITYRAALRNLSGPVSQSYPIPRFPRSSCKSCILDAMRQGSPGVLV